MSETGYMCKTKNINKIMQRVFNSKYWRNIAEFCDRKYHPILLSYRRYRKGKDRCVKCGARIGDRIMIRKSNREFLIDNLSNENTMLNILKQRGTVKCV